MTEPLRIHDPDDPPPEPQLRLVPADESDPWDELDEDDKQILRTWGKHNKP